MQRSRCAHCSLILLQVGMATNIPPHNLGEVVDALITLIRNPNATVRFSIFSEHVYLFLFSCMNVVIPGWTEQVLVEVCILMVRFTRGD